MKFIPLTVIWREGPKNAQYEGEGGVWYDCLNFIMPTPDPEVVVGYGPYFMEGITLKGSVLHYVGLVEAAVLENEMQMEIEIDEEEESEGLEN